MDEMIHRTQIHGNRHSPVYIDSSSNQPHPVPRDGVGHSAQQPGSSCSSLAVVGPANNGTAANRPHDTALNIPHSASHQFMKDLSNHSPSSHTRRDQVIEPRLTLVSGRENATARQESSIKDKHQKWTPSEKLVPVESNHSSQKRRRVFEGSDESAKKGPLQGQYYDKAQTSESSVGNLDSASLASQSPSGHSSVLELSLKTTDGLLYSEPSSGQSPYLDLLSTFKSAQTSPCTSLLPKHCPKKQPPVGAKQTSVTSIAKESLLKPGEASNERTTSSAFSFPEAAQKETGRSPSFQLNSLSSSHMDSNTSHENALKRKSDTATNKSASNPNLSYLGCRTAKRNKGARPRQPIPIPEDINELFTPDPVTYVLHRTHQTAKPTMHGATKNLSTSGNSTTVAGASCRDAQNVTVVGSPHAEDAKVSSLSSASHRQVSLPRVTLQQVSLESVNKLSLKDESFRISPEVTWLGKLDKCDGVQLAEKQTAPLPGNVEPCASETDASAAGQTSAPHGSPSPLLEKEPSGNGGQQSNEEDPIDVEQDPSFSSDLDLSSSSHSSEQLISLQEMMEPVSMSPDSPEKETFSEPCTTGYHSQSKIKGLLPSMSKSGIYKNNLDQMLKEINSNKRTKEIETHILTACKDDLLRIAEYEESEENQGEGISAEQQLFLQHYSLMSSAIKDVPPGEVVFNLEKFGRIFNPDTLELRKCKVNAQGPAQKTLLRSSPAHLKLHLNIGLFQEAYDSHSPCPNAVARFLFKMMSVHHESVVSEKILQALCDIACTAAYQIVQNGSQTFKVWVPTLADMTLVLLNMGAAFVTLFPFEDLQPAFTEGDLLEGVCIKSESPSCNKEQITFPEHNYNSILKYLSYCMALCPRAYSDDELLLLLTVLGKVNMDTRLILQSSVELYPLQCKMVNNVRDWNTVLPRICLALTDLTDDHHNMCQLVQLLPENTRGKELRQHLSLSMISKLLDGNCTYRPTESQLQLRDLRPYFCRMRPTVLLRGMLSSSRRSRKDKEDTASLDQQSYYLCYSLLTLANEASSFQIFPARQKEQLLLLCTELEIHVKCDIRESEKCLYRSKVKDLVARIYTKWQIRLRRMKPLHDKLYDYWQPLPVDRLADKQEQCETEDDEDGGQPVMEDDSVEDSSGTEDSEVLMISAKEVEEDGEDESEITKPHEMEGDGSTDNVIEVPYST
ncbi:SMC5-SMC6 complex localization factor protein 2 [Brachionichthys hirsutus]|uniref:SMC5-SMC6 complex localization factor protein 2 n=1 Tax=Brachionichthys hirsutus TaxID=412623 RepID=UPI0036051524